MIWIQENKGLATFLGLCLLGCLVLAFMSFMSYSSYSEAYAKFDSARESVKKLENAPLFPDKESVDLVNAAVEAYASEVLSLRKKLVKFQRDFNTELTGNQFQSSLAEQVERIQGLAERKKVDLPEEFRLDFDDWVNQPAPQGAVPKLDFQLEAISDLVTTLIDSGISEITMLMREKLPEERGLKSNPEDSKPLLQRFPVEVSFVAPHKGVENVINALSNAERTPNHYFIIRLLEIQNENVQGPSKDATFEPIPIYPDASGVDPLAPGVDPGLVPPAPAPVDPAAPAPVDPAAPAPVDPAFPVDPAPAFPAPPVFGAGNPIAYEDAKILLGQELVKVYLEVEIVWFTPVPPDAEDGKEPAN